MEPDQKLENVPADITLKGVSNELKERSRVG